MSTVLVVDDERAIREVIVKLLVDEGYRVVAAEDGAQALELLPRERPDLVLLDIMMPLVDGREVVRRLRQMPGLEATQVVLMSAAVAPAPDDRVAAFLPKPFDVERLLETVGQLLGEA